jgi:endonuclease/exonuclease/phosphatase family metal-dependent hydrolase
VPSPLPEVTVATFNTHWGVDRWRRPYDVVDACRQLAADVVILQEVWRADGTVGFAAEAGRRLGYTVSWLPLARGDLHAHQRLPLPPAKARLLGASSRRPRPSRGRGDWGVAILSRLPVRSEQRIDLGHLPLDPSRRGALRLDLDVAGQPFTVVGTHLSHLSHGSIWQLMRLREALPGRDRTAVLGGDMNMWGPLLALLLPGWRRSVLGRTWPAPRPHSQIDHLMVTPPVEVVGGQVMPRTGSDHRGLRVALRLRRQ